MKKTLILLFIVLMTATMFVACSSSPKEDECYDIKFEFENGVNGPLYYKKETTKSTEISTDYKLYTDPSCKTESASTLEFVVFTSPSYGYYFLISDVEKDKDWYSDNYTEGMVVTSGSITKSFKAGTVQKLKNQDSDINGDVTATFVNDVTFTVEKDPD